MDSVKTQSSTNPSLLDQCLEKSADIEIVYNEQRVKDVEVPLFNLEQKMMRLEAQMQASQMLDFDLLADSVCRKIESKLTFMLPTISMEIGKIEGMKEKMKVLSLRLDSIEQEQNAEKQGFDLQGIRFSVNRALTEVDLIKKVFTSNRIEQIEEEVKKTKMMSLDIETIKSKTDNMAQMEQIDLLKQQMADLVPLNRFEDLLIDFNDPSRDIVKHNEFKIVIKEHQFLKKDMKQFIQKDEFLQRYSILHEQLTKMLEGRPTHKDLNNYLNKFDEKFKEQQRVTQKQQDYLQQQINQHNAEFQSFGREMDKVSKDLNTKMSNNDGKRIWRHFQRFAEYNDLKELYKKCMPELARFEQRIIDFQFELDKNNLIICRFDENLANKAEKNSVETLYRYCNEKYASKQEQTDFNEKTLSEQEQQKKFFKQNQEKLNKGIESVNKKVYAEIHKIFQQMNGSYLDDSKCSSNGNIVGINGSHHQNNLVSLINRKVDQLDFNEMLSTKTNKKETSMMFDQISILHRQIESLASVIQQQVRMKLDAHPIESKNQKRNNQLQLLNQIMAISNRINQLDLDNINDVFNTNSKAIGASQLAQVDKSVKLDVGNRPSYMSQSPNKRREQKKSSTIVLNELATPETKAFVTCATIKFKSPKMKMSTDTIHQQLRQSTQDIRKQILSPQNIKYHKPGLELSRNRRHIALNQSLQIQKGADLNQQISEIQTSEDNLPMVVTSSLDLDQMMNDKSNFQQSNNSYENDLTSSFTFETSPSNFKAQIKAKRTNKRPIGIHSPLAEVDRMDLVASPMEIQRNPQKLLKLQLTRVQSPKLNNQNPHETLHVKTESTTEDEAFMTSTKLPEL